MKKDKNIWLRIGIGVFLLFLAMRYWDTAALVLGMLLSAGVPLIVGCCIAYPLNLLMDWYERRLFGRAQHPAAKKLKRPTCMLLAIVTLLGVLALVLWLVIPEFAACVQLLLAKIPAAISNVTAWLQQHKLMTAEIAAWLESWDWKSKLDQLTQMVTSGVSSVMGTVLIALGSVFSGVVTAFLAIVFALYLLAGKERIGSQIRRTMQHYFSEKTDRRIMHVITTLDDCFHRYIVGQCTEAVILGALCTVGMLLLGLPYATMIGALIAVTALIPVAGAYIGALVGAFMILTVSPVKALIFIVFLVVLQQIEGNLIYPRVVGSSVGLPGIWVLAAVTVGGGVLGIGGMFFAVPIAAAVWRLVREAVKQGKKQNDMDGIVS